MNNIDITSLSNKLIKYITESDILKSNLSLEEKGKFLKNSLLLDTALKLNEYSRQSLENADEVIISIFTKITRPSPYVSVEAFYLIINCAPICPYLGLKNLDESHLDYLIWKRRYIILEWIDPIDLIPLNKVLSKNSLKHLIFYHHIIDPRYHKINDPILSPIIGDRFIDNVNINERNYCEELISESIESINDITKNFIDAKRKLYTFKKELNINDSIENQSRDLGSIIFDIKEPLQASGAFKKILLSKIDHIVIEYLERLPGLILKDVNYAEIPRNSKAFAPYIFALNNPEILRTYCYLRDAERKVNIDRGYYIVDYPYLHDNSHWTIKYPFFTTLLVNYAKGKYTSFYSLQTRIHILLNMSHSFEALMYEYQNS